MGEEEEKEREKNWPTEDRKRERERVGYFMSVQRAVRVLARAAHRDMTLILPPFSMVVIRAQMHERVCSYEGAARSVSAVFYPFCFHALPSFFRTFSHCCARKSIVSTTNSSRPCSSID